MKKLWISLIGVFGVLTIYSLPVFAIATPYTGTKPADAATTKDIQGQSSSSSLYQNNNLKQDAGNMSSGTSSGSADILKNSNNMQILRVTGAPANPDSLDDTGKKIPWFGIVVLAGIMVVPLVIIWKQIQGLKKDAEKNKQNTLTETTQENETEIDTDTTENTIENSETTKAKPKTKTKKKRKSKKNHR